MTVLLASVKKLRLKLLFLQNSGLNRITQIRLILLHGFLINNYYFDYEDVFCFTQPFPLKITADNVLLLNLIHLHLLF